MLAVSFKYSYAGSEEGFKHHSRPMTAASPCLCAIRLRRDCVVIGVSTYWPPYIRPTPGQHDRHQQTSGSQREHTGDVADVELPDVAHQKVPATALSVPQSTLTIGEDYPLPGGESNGVGNLRPDTPLTKCGTALTRKAPPKKYAMYKYQRIVPSTVEGQEQRDGRIIARDRPRDEATPMRLASEHDERRSTILLSPLLPLFALLAPTRMVYTRLRLTVGSLGSG